LYPPFVSATPKNATESGKIAPRQNAAYGGKMPLALERRPHGKEGFQSSVSPHSASEERWDAVSVYRMVAAVGFLM
jgi:hypothetical protein